MDIVYSNLFLLLNFGYGHQSTTDQKYASVFLFDNEWITFSLDRFFRLHTYAENQVSLVPFYNSFIKLCLIMFELHISFKQSFLLYSRYHIDRFQVFLIYIISSNVLEKESLNELVLIKR